jgi:hypothetical protein
MAKPQETQFAKVAAIAGVLVVVLGSLAFWGSKHLKSLRLEPPALAARQAAEQDGKEPAPRYEPPRPPQSAKDPHPVASALDALHRAERAAGSASDPQPSDQRPDSACATETATVRRGAPVRVASGLALLSVNPNTHGSGSVLLFSIATENHVWSEAVVETPARYDFETRKGAYYLEVKEADPVAGTLRVEVGCGGG